ncbi:MAG TPA: alpha/beta hydrolase [Anaerolineales bacterium]|jgi:acetyl esterase/lipase
MKKTLRTTGRSALFVILITCLVLSAACSSSTPAPTIEPTALIEATAVVLPLTPTPTAEASHTAESNFQDIAYAAASSAELLDLYVPAGSGPFPVVLYVHGGGFRMGDKILPVRRGIAARLLAAGYALASINYRLSGEATFPAQIQDAKAAVRWLRAHASEYDLDPDRIAAWGDSAGANLVSLLGTSCGAPELEGAELGNAEQSSCVQLVVDFYGPIDFVQMDEQFAGTLCPQTHDKPNSAESAYVGGPIQENRDLVQAANPITYITPDDPPFFIEHGTLDCTVPFQQSQLLYDALTLVLGADNVKLTLLEGADHGDDQFVSRSNLDLVLEFLDAHLK